jgi:hypothetical protein
VDPELANEFRDRRAGFGLAWGRRDLLRGKAFSHGQNLGVWE